MKHLGDITKINGTEVDPVDVIIGGSPCQDLSNAGKREGIKHSELGSEGTTRSGLFVEQIRIVREQRNESIKRSDNPIRLRYMVWENVPGAFSSNKAEDFRIVLEETARIADSNAVIPRPPNGKWATAGCIMGDGWSIAWRVQDAQFWGVPQRRRRIALVADFGGYTAPEILFERKGVSGNIEKSETKREGTAGDAEGGVGAASGVKCLTAWDCQSKRIFDPSGCFNTLPAMDCGGANNQAVFCEPTCAGFSYKASAGAGTIGYGEDISPSVLAQRQDAAVFDARGNGDGENVPTITGDHGNRVTDYTALVARMTAFGQYETDSTFSAMKQRDYKDATDLVVQSERLFTPCNFGQEGQGYNENTVTNTLDSVGGSKQTQLIGNHFSVRRLTPLECERLQGYPDGWTDIPQITDMISVDVDFWNEVDFTYRRASGRLREHEDGWHVWTRKKVVTGHCDDGDEIIESVWMDTGKPYKPMTKKQVIKWYNKLGSDSARYKALGNSIALPPWRFVLSRLHAHGARTLGSLFDGISGFPLIWSELPGTKTLWTSEIEPFPIAVAHCRFIANRKDANMTTHDEVWLTTNEFMEQFVISSISSVFEKMKYGMPHKKVNGKLMFPKYACHRWFAGCDDARA